MINLMLPKRKFLDQFDNCYLVPIDDKSKIYLTVFLFSDCIILGKPSFSSNLYDYMGSTVFDEKSQTYSKQDLKYYTNIFKVTGKTSCFIIGANSIDTRDLIL